MTKLFYWSIKISDELEDTACGDLKRFARKDILFYIDIYKHIFQSI